MTRRPQLSCAALLLGLLVAPAHGEDSPPEEIAAIVSQLQDANWGQVQQAKLVLESREGAGIPALIALLDSKASVALTHTADLIYPGAKTFYGHGHLVDYDLDRIAIRAGWVLEELTFQDFGFSEESVREPELLKAAAQSPARDVPLDDVVERPSAEQRSARHAAAIERAKAWWAKQDSAHWSRLDSLVAALEGPQTGRLSFTVCWIRYGETRCDGLTLESYTARLLPRIRKLAASTRKDVRVQAKHLLADEEAYWLKCKQRNLR